MAKIIMSYKDIKIGDNVIFKNIFATLSGQIVKIEKINSQCVIIYIKRIDETGLYSTYEIPYKDIVEVLNALDKFKAKNKEEAENINSFGGEQ